MDNVHMVVPGFGSKPASWNSDFGNLTESKGIDRFLGRCRQHTHLAYDGETHGYETLLCDLFDIPKDAYGNLPMGAIRRLGITGIRGITNYLCADPVSLHAGQREVILKDATSLDIHKHETESLTRLFNEHYVSEEWKLTADTPEFWHLAMSSPQAVFLPPVSEVVNRKLNTFLSSGEQSRYWRKILNEIQMLFHNAEVNRIRETEGRPVINGLWLYGGGELPEQASCQWHEVFADHPLAVGLARLAGTNSGSVPDSFEDLFAKVPASSCLIGLDALQRAVTQDDISAWKTTIDCMDERWFRPMLQAIVRGRLSNLVVYDCAGHKYEIRRRDLMKFWKTAKSILTLCGENST